MKTWVKVLIGVVAAGIIAITAGPFVYIHFIKDDVPDALSLDDVPTHSNAIDASDQATTTGPTDSVGGPVTTASSATASTEATDGSTTGTTSSVDGSYTLTADSQVGYRVVEVLFGQDTEGVGRTNSVSGTMTITGTEVSSAEFTVDMTTLKSDESRRDAQFQGRIMETSKFPTATFVITEPIELGSVPADGDEISATATGDLTLHGSTKSITIDVTAKRTGDSIAVAGSTDVLFADYDIANPSNRGITTQDHGLIEFLLVFAGD